MVKRDISELSIVMLGLPLAIKLFSETTLR